jgi:hypothetical protein
MDGVALVFHARYIGARRVAVSAPGIGRHPAPEHNPTSPRFYRGGRFWGYLSLGRRLETSERPVSVARAPGTTGVGRGPGMIPRRGVGYEIRPGRLPV